MEYRSARLSGLDGCGRVFAHSLRLAGAFKASVEGGLRQMSVPGEASIEKVVFGEDIEQNLVGGVGSRFNSEEF